MIVRVSESGLKNASDLLAVRQLGYDAFLIGERFMTEDDPGAALHALVSSPPALDRRRRGRRAGTFHLVRHVRSLPPWW